MKLGIDFGTTRTVVAVCDQGNTPVLSFVGPDGVLTEWYPSAMAMTSAGLVTGHRAVVASRDDHSVVLLRSIKRVMSAPEVTHETIVDLGHGQAMPLLDVLTLFFEALKRAIVKDSNVPARLLEERHFEAVIAVPAGASSGQRFTTMEACRRAGIEVIAMLNEPSAGGIEYAHRYARTFNSKRAEVVVYDLGGGTFDASRVSMGDGAHEVVLNAGRRDLGGDDFDAVLARLVLERVSLDFEQLGVGTKARLLEHCRQVKEQLHPNTRRAVLDLWSCLSLRERTQKLCKDEPIIVDIAEYYVACTPLVADTLAVLERVLPQGEDALEGVAGVSVVGGASQLPVVARALREEYGHRVHRSPYPSASTAMGLALVAASPGEVEIHDRLSRHFGVFREGEGGSRVTFDPIFGNLTRVPMPGDASTEMVRVYRPVHNIGHFRYVECAELDALGRPTGDMTPFADILFPFEPRLRELVGGLDGVRIERIGEGALIEERYSVSAQGVIELTIRDLETGYERRHELAGQGT
ncbi:MAG: Hsp70 family protein, partial [Myxococcota bacterium]